MILNQDIEDIKNIILNTTQVEKIYLFGSFAYGKPNEESDYDFYVVVPDGSDRPLLITQGIYRALFGKTNKRPVDILVKRHSDFYSRKDLLTLENVVFNQGVMIYGK